MLSSLRELINETEHALAFELTPHKIEALQGTLDKLRVVEDQIEEHDIAQDFEENLELYISEHFNSARNNFQLEILKAIIGQFDALEFDELNDALKEAEIKYMKLVDTKELKSLEKRIRDLYREETAETKSEELLSIAENIDSMVNC